MSATYGMSPPVRSDDAHPLRTIREIRASLPGDQLVHFDAELAETDIAELESMLTRWATLANDGFEEFLLSAPFEDLDFGGRSYDERPESE
ncbi:hypothetical protein Aple_066590 [Acrocarpospora pleiomorpha]|uniref:Uncharacterized protein n=1 Tax=Acrocarpospora pleiomorpha TaxID=90975 RepID=A0A5M3XSJ4_9ACTN|nr:hypothetical protein [Acrocarpospora pleiomorpha]GES23760.1 hypothetical protein Aple_066590 [Acrocarpospora pleiomorpha]